MKHSHLTVQRSELVAVECADPACPMIRRPCSHGPDRRCFNCATDEEVAASIPDFPSTGDTQ